MFEPGSTLDDLRDNLRFIEQQGLLGYFPPLIFGKLLLMPGTPAREQYQREHGVNGDIHQLLSYEFEDARVTRVYDLLGDFQRRFGNRWFELAFSLLDGIPAWEIDQRQSNGAAASGGLSARQLAQLKLEFFALTRIPYQLMREGLETTAQGAPQDAHVKLLAKAEDELARVSQRVQQLRP